MMPVTEHKGLVQANPNLSQFNVVNILTNLFL